MESTENWLPIPGYEGFYEVSDQGRVRSLDRLDAAGRPRRGRVVTPHVTAYGHLSVTLHRDRKGTSKAIQRAVLEAFVGPCPDGQEAVHIDGDQGNNMLPNLRWGRRLDNLPLRDPETCSVETCPGRAKARGYCGTHWLRWRKYGDPLGKAPKVSMEDRFWAKVTPTGFCWEWSAYLDGTGYGTFYRGPGQMARAHRLAYELLVGPIPDDLPLDHLCRNPKCVNPDHLEPVTNAENSRRGFSPGMVAARTNVCQRGHSMDNAYIRPDTGARQCAECIRLRWKGEA